MSESGKQGQPEKQEGGKERVTDKSIKQIFGKLGALQKTKWEDLSIYKVPSKLRKVKKDAYDPRVVSIGPFHRKNLDVAAMREHKWRYMLSFVQQTDDRNQSQTFLKELFNAIYNLDGVVRRCYAEEIKQNKNELTEIMLLDGCFILELFLRYDPRLNYKKSEGPDPIIKSAWMITSLRQDLALLENQIPFFILIKLYDVLRSQQPHVGMECKPPSSVASLALYFFHPYLRQKSEKEDGAVEIGEIDQYKHLLDLLHKFYFFPPAPPAPPAQADNVINMESTLDNGHRSDASAAQQTSSSSCFFLRREKQNSCHSKPDPKNTKKWGFNYCASELRESGISFRTIEDHRFLNISFKGGELTIPQLLIHETTSSLFRNLIAYEQCSLGSTPFVTSYAFLMTSLIRSSLDSKLLQKNDIIKHQRVEDKEYLVQFQNILEEVVIKDDDFYFGPECDQVTKYCKSCCNWNKLQVFLRVRLLRDTKLLYSTYFSSTWSIISFLGAVVALILTGLQTHYTINPRS